MNCALIGTSKFAELHFYQLVRIGVKEIVIISRDFKKSENICKRLKKKFININIYSSKIDILKKKKFDLIDICSANYIHHKHISYIINLKSIILIEKPIFSLLKLKSNYHNFFNYIYKKNKKIFVLYQMYYLSKLFNKYLKKEKIIKDIYFNFKTGGQYKGKEISIDLVPHALSFFFGLLDISCAETKITINKKKINKDNCSFHLTYKKINFYIYLEEAVNNKTQLNIKINKKIIQRITKKINGNFTNFLKEGSKLIKISNPLDLVFNDFKKNMNDKNLYYKNKLLTKKFLNLNANMLN